MHSPGNLGNTIDCFPQFSNKVYRGFMKEHNQQGLIVCLVILAFNVLFFGYISFIHPGVSGVDKPAAVQKK